MSGPIEIDVDRCRIGDGIIETDGLDEGPVTGRAAVGRDDAVAGPFLGAHSPQAKFHHAELLPLSHVQLHPLRRMRGISTRISDSGEGIPSRRLYWTNARTWSAYQS